VDKIARLAGQLRSVDEEERRAAVIGLAGFPVAETKEQLYTALGDASWRVRKEAVDALLAVPLPLEIIEEIVNLLASDNAGLRNSAVEVLERVGAPAMPVLCRHVEDSDHDVRKFVMDILGTIGDDRAVPLLAKALDDPEPNVCAAAAENLGKIGDGKAVPHLLRALEKNDIWLRYTILEALGKIGKTVPMAVIAPLAGEKLLTRAVFDCLGAVGDEEAIPLLLEGIRDRVKNLREGAVVALMKVRDRLPAEAARQLVDEKLEGFNGAPFLEGLISSLETSDRELQAALIRVLGTIGDERAAEGLLRSFHDDRLRKHSLEAFRSMAARGSAVLVRMFPDAAHEERSFIVYICGELRFEGAAQLIREGMKDADPILRGVAVKAAGKAAMPGLMREIAPLLEDTERDVRAGAVEALACLTAQDGEAVRAIAAELAGARLPEKRCSAAVLFARLADAEKLSLLIKDDDAIVRRAAVHALAGLKRESSISHLAMALADEEADVRIAAAAALGEMGGKDILDPLLLAMQDEDPWVKCTALKSLGKIGHEAAKPEIMGILASSSDGMVKISALEALAQIGGTEVVAVVKQALLDPDEEVIKAAIDILMRQDEQWLDEYRAQLLRHPHWDVRRSFLNAVAAGRGATELPLFRSALEAETDELVREQLLAIIDRYQ